MPNVVWAMTMVSMPRPAGQPIGCSSATNSSSSDRPVITSGITSGAVTRPANSVRPRKRPKRASAKPASVPSTSAPVAPQRGDAERQPAPPRASPSLCSELAIPVRREAGPHRDQPRGVEGIDDQRRRSARRGRRSRAPARRRTAGAGCSCLLRLAAPAGAGTARSAPTSSTSMATATAEAARPVAVVEELVPQHLADHQRVRAAQQVGDDELADRRDEDQQRSRRRCRAATAARSRARKAAQRPAAEIGRRLEQRRIELLERGVERQHHERQVGIDDADIDREVGVEERQRLVRSRPSAEQRVVDRARCSSGGRSRHRRGSGRRSRTAGSPASAAAARQPAGARAMP